MPRPWYGSDTGLDSIEITADHVHMCRNGMSMFSGQLFNETVYSAGMVADVAFAAWTPRTVWLCRKLIFPAVGPLGSGSVAAAAANKGREC